MVTNSAKYQKEWIKKHPDSQHKYYETFKLKHPNFNKEQYEKHQKRIIIYRNSHKKEAKEYKKKRDEEIMNILRIKVGDKCVLCGMSEKIHYHEINGIRHRNDKQYYLNHLQDFIPLCSYCHNLVHKIARRKLSLEKISEIIKRLI